MNLSISISCADINEAMEVLKKLGDKVSDVVVQPTGSKDILAPAKATRTPKAVKTPAPAAVEEVNPVEDVGAVEATAENIEADYKKSLTDARALLVGKGVGTKEKALVMAIKSQCLALTGSEDTNAVVNPDDMSALTALINAEIAKYKGA